jgi:hypothetical protein
MIEQPPLLARSRTRVPFPVAHSSPAPQTEPTIVDHEAIAQAARRLAHRLNNDLALPAGALELLGAETDLPPRLRDLIRDAAAGIAAATSHVAEFQRLLSAQAATDTPPSPATRRCAAAQ